MPGAGQQTSGIVVVVGGLIAAGAALYAWHSSWAEAEPASDESKTSSDSRNKLSLKAVTQLVATEHAKRPQSTSSRPPASLTAEAAACVSEALTTASTHGKRWILQSVADGLPFAELVDSYDRLRQQVPATARVVLLDLPRTCPKDKDFAEGGRHRAHLKDVLFAAANENRRGYTQGMNFLAAQLLRHMSPPAAFAVLVGLLSNERIGLCHVYAPGLPGVETASAHLHTLMTKHSPELAAHLEAVNFDYRFILDWYFCLYTTVLPPGVIDSVWDLIFSCGWMGVLYVVVSLLQGMSVDNRGTTFEATYTFMKQLPSTARNDLAASAERLLKKDLRA